MHRSFVMVTIIAFASCDWVADKELQCYYESKIYHWESDECFSLLEEGPCQPGEWLVLQKPVENEWDADVIPVCAEKKCGEEEYFWPKTGQCVHWTDKYGLCDMSLNEEPVVNLFGETECLCGSRIPSARLFGDKRSPCYELYKQGPCPYGCIFVLPEGGASDAFCLENPCHTESVIRKEEGTLSEDGVLAIFNDGRCYELNTQGPCGSDMIFRIDDNSKTPECTESTVEPAAVIPVIKCNIDINGDCQKGVPRRIQEGKSYVREFRRLLLSLQVNPDLMPVFSNLRR